jgi:hypothetical protein
VVPVDGTGIHHERAPESRDLIDLVESVQEIVVADDLAKVRAAATDDPSFGPGVSGEKRAKNGSDTSSGFVSTPVPPQE